MVCAIHQYVSTIATVGRTGALVPTIRLTRFLDLRQWAMTDVAVLASAL